MGTLTKNGLSSDNNGNSLNSFVVNVLHDKETSQLICNSDQLTGFYMMGNTDLKWVKNDRWKILSEFYGKTPVIRKANKNKC